MKVKKLTDTPCISLVYLTTRQTVYFVVVQTHMMEKSPEFRLIPAKTLELRETILFVSDLPAANVVYHKQCSVNFNTGKRVPQTFACRQSYDPSATKYPRLSDRPKDEVRSKVFLQVTRYLVQNGDEQITIQDLINHMRSVIAEENCEPYSFPYMKSQLLKHLGERIIIEEINGKSNVVTFHSTSYRILHVFHTQKHKDPEQKNAKKIKTAAQLFKNDIKTIKQTTDVYPSSAEMASSEAAIEYIPDCLKTFLKIVFAGKNIDVKLASIGQVIMQAVRPRVLMAPLQIGLGV